MAGNPRPLVSNAADPRQVRYARRKERDREGMFLAALKQVLQTVEGRFVFAELLDRAGLYQTVYDHSGSTVYFREGRRNFGLEIQAHLIEADEPRYEEMEREQRARKRSLDRETQAVQQPAETGGIDGS